ncbi:MAG: glycerate kinase [Bacilli bacterium]
MRILVLTDPFKGTLSPEEVYETLQSVLPEEDWDFFPMSDGGEGTLDSYRLLYPEAKDEEILLSGIRREGKRKASFLRIGEEAILESSQAIGFVSEKEDPDRDPFAFSSFPLGEMVKACKDLGIRKLRIGLGGTATSDGGAGLLEALGFTFFSKEGILHPVGRNLEKITSFSFPQGYQEEEERPEITILSDVKNPLLGDKGAIASFARQKGGKEEEFPRMEEGLQNYSRILEKGFASSCSLLPGAGAAGGAGFALLLLGGKIVSGASALLQEKKVIEKMKKADLIITGEGRIDATTLNGKAAYEVYRKAVGLKKKVLFVCGSYDPKTKKELTGNYTEGFVSALKEGEVPSSFDFSKEGAKKNLASSFASSSLPCLRNRKKLN